MRQIIVKPFNVKATTNAIRLFSTVTCILKKENKYLKIYINNLLKKSFIRLLKSNILYRILFILKKNKELRLYINFRRLNKIIKKN